MVGKSYCRGLNTLNTEKRFCSFAKSCNVWRNCVMWQPNSWVVIGIHWKWGLVKLCRKGGVYFIANDIESENKKKAILHSCCRVATFIAIIYLKLKLLQGSLERHILFDELYIYIKFSWWATIKIQNKTALLRDLSLI